VDFDSGVLFVHSLKFYEPHLVSAKIISAGFLCHHNVALGYDSQPLSLTLILGLVLTCNVSFVANGAFEVCERYARQNGTESCEVANRLTVITQLYSYERNWRPVDLNSFRNSERTDL
jgi:hypothetical protein